MPRVAANAPVKQRAVEKTVENFIVVVVFRVGLR